MDNTWISSDRVEVTPATDPMQGQIRWNPSSTLWLLGNGALGLTGVILFPQLDALLVFIVLSGTTICAGHSVGMHRLLIHRSFRTQKGVQYFLVWLGTLVGMAGPFGMIRTHDMRDWYQRQSICPDHPAHRAGFWRDAFWQLCCTYDPKSPPKFVIEPEVANDKAYQAMERTWRWQQLVLAVPLFLIGGWAWVLWGCCLRVFVSLSGHWAVGHFAHRKGQQTWIVKGLPVQGYNLPSIALLTFGENWHSNHHAFPHSAKLGLERGQLDPGYWFILALARLGLANSINGPQSKPPRTGLTRKD